MPTLNLWSFNSKSPRLGRSPSHNDKRFEDDASFEKIQILSNEVEELRAQLWKIKRDRDAQRAEKISQRVHSQQLGESLRELRQQVAASIECYDIPSTSNHSRECHESTIISRLDALQLQAHKYGWALDPSEVKLFEKVGEGVTAEIFRGVWHGINVAVKCVRPSFMQQGNLEQIDAFCQEVEVLARQRHPFVLRLLCASLNPPNHAWVVTEYLSKGTLTEWLHGQKKRESKRTSPLPPVADRLRVTVEIAKGMQYLHEQSPVILHRDLKPSNVFLDEHLHVRIADFGLSRQFLPTDTVLTGEIGTYVYMAPEVFRHEIYNEKCDIYSFAVILCEILTGDPPYIDTKLRPIQIATAVENGSLRPTLPKQGMHLNLMSLMTAAWDCNPAKRPSFAQIAVALECHFEEVTKNCAADGNWMTGGEQLHEFLHGLFGKGNINAEQIPTPNGK